MIRAARMAERQKTTNSAINCSLKQMLNGNDRIYTSQFLKSTKEGYYQRVKLRIKKFWYQLCFRFKTKILLYITQGMSP